MAFPSPITNVPRERVGMVVQDMLDDPDVSLVEAHEEANGRFTVIPHHSSVSVSSTADFTRFKKSDFPDA